MMADGKSKSLVPILAVTGAALATGTALLLYWYRDRAIGSRPYKKGVPILKGAKALMGHAAVKMGVLQFHNDWMLEQEKIYGDVYQYTMPFQNVVCTHNVQDVESVLKDPYLWAKAEDTRLALHDFLGDGIFNANGDIWRNQRKVASNIFNIRNFRQLFTTVFIEKSMKLVSTMDRAYDLGAAIELQDMLLRATMDSFVMIAMSKNPGAIAMNGFVNKNGVYQMEIETFMEAFDSANNISIIRIFKPFWQIIDQFDGTAAKQKHNMDVMDSFAREVIRQKQNAIDKGYKGRDLLDLFMEAANLDGTPLTERQMIDVVLNFIIAGRDTTAQTLCWMFLRLSANPEVETKCREELIQVLGHNGDYSYEKFGQLKYNIATFMETLRLHANVPFNRKEAQEDTILLGTNTPMKKGDMVDYTPYAMGFSEKIWGANAKEFKPERWFDQNGNIIKPNTFAFPHFNAGPRICLGMNMAQQEAVTFMSAILRKYHLEACNEEDPKHWGNYERKLGRSSLALTLNVREGAEFKLHRVTA